MTPSKIFEEPMKYLCLVYVDEKKLKALSKPEMDALVADALAYDEMASCRSPMARLRKPRSSLAASF
jgi:hypothetical protein